ncbi:MAG TPA: hypothetical protein VM261_02290 [Kofleriaceae bacterium]|nr:hypothetical protein [Kofleriaceae bacterium]
MRPGSRLTSALVAVVMLAGACTSGDTKSQPPTETTPTVSTTPPTVSSFAEVKAADGKVVRVTGKIQHEKLGDTVILADGLDILCPDFRVRDDVTEATLEGQLELWEPPVAGTNDKGEISQGVTEPTTRWVLRGCKQI